RDPGQPLRQRHGPGPPPDAPAGTLGQGPQGAAGVWRRAGKQPADAGAGGLAGLPPRTHRPGRAGAGGAGHPAAQAEDAAAPAAIRRLGRCRPAGKIAGQPDHATLDASRPAPPRFSETELMPHSALSLDVPLPRAGQHRAYWRAPTSGTALAAAALAAAQRHAGPLLLVARDNHAAHQLEADLRTLAGDDETLPVLGFPDWETLPFDRFSPHPEIVSQRLATLARLPELTRGVVVVPASTLMQRLAPRAHVPGNRFSVRVGQRMDMDGEKRRLEAAGYRNVPQVFDPGDFAVRGGLLDVYPMGADAPFRVELLDDEIDSIRTFDPESQRSLEKVATIELLPGREVPMDDAHVQRALDA